MSQFSLLGAGFTDPEISPTDRQECRDRPTGEISGLGWRVRASAREALLGNRASLGSGPRGARPSDLWLRLCRAVSLWFNLERWQSSIRWWFMVGSWTLSVAPTSPLPPCSFAPCCTGYPRTGYW